MNRAEQIINQFPPHAYDPEGDPSAPFADCRPCRICSGVAGARPHVVETLETVPTPDLNIGDLVLDHGVRVRLGKRHATLDRGPGVITTVFDGVIENIDELRESDPGLLALLDWIADETNVSTYRIQGDHLAHWTRVVES